MSSQRFLQITDFYRIAIRDFGHPKVTRNPIGCGACTLVVRSAHQMFGASDFDKKFGKQDRA